MSSRANAFYIFRLHGDDLRLYANFYVDFLSNEILDIGILIGIMDASYLHKKKIEKTHIEIFMTHEFIFINTQS